SRIFLFGRSVYFPEYCRDSSTSGMDAELQRRSSTYSYVAFWFDPYYAITISKPGIKHEPSDVSDDGILLSLHEHIISNKTGHPARSKDSIEVACEMINQSEKLAIVLEQVRIVERGVIVGWARHH